MSDFNPARSRANRPCPLWIDAFHRKTQHLQTDEIGAYILILMAMWSQEDCSLPDDDVRLARVAKVSTRLWNSRIGPVIREFLTAENGAVFSKRLREEAGYVERQVKQQSDRKSGKKSDKSLENNEPDKSTDTTTDQSGTNPSQQPNNPTIEEKEETKVSSKKPTPEIRGSTIPPDWRPSENEIKFAVDQGMTRQEIENEADRFRDFWIAKPGASGRKKDWGATWRNWIRKWVEDHSQRKAFVAGRSSGGRRPSGGITAAANRLLFEGENY